MSVLNTQNRKKTGVLLGCLFVLLPFVYLLLISRGFPQTGDDWYFYPTHRDLHGFFDWIRYGFDRAVEHYHTTNGRYLGNFLAAFTACSKPLRELIRCGIILGIFLCLYRLIKTENRRLNLVLYALAFALLIAIPAKIAAQTYAWAAGFFNYVPPTLLFLLYLLHLCSAFCRETRSRSILRCVGLLLLGLSSAFFMENFTIGLCLLSLAVVIMDWARSKRLDLTLLLHFLGIAIGCYLMFSAPGYGNVGNENYRKIPSDLDGIVEIVVYNFWVLSGFLTRDNFLIVIPISLFGAAVCLKACPDAPEKKARLLRALVAVYICCPVLFYAKNLIGNYTLKVMAVDVLCHGLYFLAMLLTAVLAIKNKALQLTVAVSAITFVLFISPLMVVFPVGARNAYFFDVLLILIALSFFREAVSGLQALRPAALPVCLACLLLLFGNFWIYHKNAKAETLRHEIIDAAMARGETEVTLPLFPCENYVHQSSGIAINWCYFYTKEGDIHFTFVPYSDFISNQ